MAITRAQTLARARDMLDEEEVEADGAEGQWTNDQLRQFADAAARDIATQVRWKRASGTVAVSASTQEYNLPSDAIELHTVYFVETGTTTVFPLTYTDFNVILTEASTELTRAENRPNSFWTWGYPGSTTFKINLFPVPSVGGTLTIHYYALPTDLGTGSGSDATAEDIPIGYEEMVPLFVTYRALMRDRRHEEAAYFKSEYETKLRQLGDMSQRFIDQPGNISEGPRFVPWYLNHYQEGWV